MALFDGVKKFQDEQFPNLSGKFAELKNGQSPETLFVTCSDSRISPNLLTQTDPGDIFVIRNAGNMVPEPGTGELAMEATIEYAVKVLKVKNIIVCGHSHCGAVGGLLQLDGLDSLPAVRDWVKKSEAILGDLPEGEDRMSEALKANVRLQLSNLRKYPYVESALAAGELALHGWIYHFELGQVDFIDEVTSASA